NEVATRRRQRARCHNQTDATLLPEIRQHAFDVGGVAYLGRRYRYSHLRAGGLNDAQKRYIWCNFGDVDDRNTAQPGSDLVEIGKPLAADCRLEIMKTCNFSAGT